VVQEAYQVKYFVTENAGKNDAMCLSLFVSANNFQYAIFTNECKVLIECADIELKQNQSSSNNPLDLIHLLIQNYFLNQKKFEKVNICVLNNKFTLLPEAFAESTDMNALMNFSGGEQFNNKILQHKTKYCYFCYAIPIDWLDYFGKTFPQASIRHAAAVNVSLLFEQFSLSQTQLYLNLHQSQLEISVKTNNQFIFYNVFSFESKEDILYFLLFTMEQLNLNPLVCKLSIAGQLETNDDLIKSIKKYVKSVDFCVLDKSVTIANKTTAIPNHYYFTLLNQHLCAL